MKIHHDRDPESAFARAYEEYADAIFRHCYFRSFDRERGKELMQETFMKTWEYVARGNDIEDIRPFLYRVASNLVINDAKRRKRRSEDSLETLRDEGFDVADESAQDPHTKLDAERVVVVLQNVEEPYRDVLVMRFIDELQPAEIAELIGETPNAVSVRINRGLKILRSLLKDG